MTGPEIPNQARALALENAASPGQELMRGLSLVNSDGNYWGAKGAIMSLTELFDMSDQVSGPLPGSVNVRVGKAVEGPGGRWVPCASAIADGAFVACVYEVGPGRKQVCAANRPTNCAEEALSRAVELAAMAAA